MDETVDPQARDIPDDAFKQVENKARELHAQYIETRIDWYRTHTAGPRFWFRWAGIVTIIFSVTLPALAAATFPYKELALSVTSIAIAALTGLSSFYKWERTWRANSTAQIMLEQHVAKWELELTNARVLVPRKTEPRMFTKQRATSLPTPAM
jgi:hypothetical protein